MKRFQAFALREGRKKYFGKFDALDIEDARRKLKAQNYDILSLKEVTHSRWPLIIILLITLFFSAFIFLMTRSNKPTPLPAFHTSRPRPKSPIQVLGKWVRLRSGDYLIAASEEAYCQAIKYRNTGDRKNLDQLYAGEEVGQTQKYGGGQKVYVQAWNDTEHVVEIKFENTEITAWVEEEAIL